MAAACTAFTMFAGTCVMGHAMCVALCCMQTDDPRKSSLVRCCRSDVQRLLGISRGGEAALQCIAQLAGGDYDITGAEQVRCLAVGDVLIRRGCTERQETSQVYDCSRC
jgi:hypothetical protein